MEELLWKTVSPEETITTINDILNKNNIITNFSWTGWFPQLNTYSNHITINQSNFGTSGKGNTPLLAEASGKAEFIERLCFDQLSPYKRNHKIKFFEDEKIENGILKRLFFNVNTNNNEYIDCSDNHLFKSSIGLAAGNTIEEAFTHSICELLEHYGLHLIAHNKFKINFEYIVDDLDFIINFKNAIPNLRSLHFYNISIGKIPIVLMFIIRKDNTYALKVDCAPTHTLAIRRAISEFLQGVNNQFSGSFSKIVIADEIPADAIYSLFGVSNRHYVYPKHIIDNIFNQPKSYKNIVNLNTFTSNLECIEAFMNYDSKIFLDNILIKDYSFLNFPVIKILPIPNNNNKDIYKYNYKYPYYFNTVSHKALYETKDSYYLNACQEFLKCYNEISNKYNNQLETFEDKFIKYKNFTLDNKQFDFLKNL